MEEQDRLKLLKEILLDDKNSSTTDLINKINKIESLINEDEKLATRIDPLVDAKINNFASELPVKFSPLIVQALKKEISNSQDAVIEALFPIIGKLIKKSIKHEIQLLNERITQQINNTFSFKNWFTSKSKRSAIATEAIARSQNPELLQILVVDKESGILRAHFENTDYESVDKDLIAGMLTAIKSFVEDAFKGGDQALETINYEFYTLHIQNFHKYYITAVVNGVYSVDVKDKLEDMILDFAENGVSKESLQNDKLFTNELKLFFSGKSI